MSLTVRRARSLSSFNVCAAGGRASISSSSASLPTSRRLVKGPAGCGKTRAALSYCGTYLEDNEGSLLDYQRVLVLSFTRAAITRLTQATSQLLSPAQRARLVINTFAGFKWELLSRFGRYLGLGVSPKLVSAMALLPGIDARPDEIGFAAFSDHVLRLLRQSSSLAIALRARYPLLIVDEFQDTDDADWELVQILSRDGSLGCYGDPNQAVGMTTVEYAERRMNAAEAYGCQLEVMSGSSMRDRSKERVITGVAESIRTGAAVRLNAERARAAGALAIRRYAYPNMMPVSVKQAVRDITKAHSDWSIGIIVLQKVRVDWLSGALITRQPTANFPLFHGTVGREDRCLGADPFLLAAWARSSGELVTDMELLRLCGIAVAAVMDARTLGGLSSELIAASTGNKPVKGVSKKVLQLLPQETRSNVATISFSRVQETVRALDSKLFEYFALPRIEALRSRLERRLQQGANSTQELLDHGLDLSLEEAGLDKHAAAYRIQLMNIDSCKGREFDALLIANHPQDQFPRPEDGPQYLSARAKLYTAITRARYLVAVVAPAQKPCAVLDELL